LGDAYDAAQAQRAALETRVAELSGKVGRDDLISHYEHDLHLLEERSQSMCRVLALVWKTRAILLLRAHLAIAARQQPVAVLPDESKDLEAATRTYDELAKQVRQFVREIEARQEKLLHVIPAEPENGLVTDVLRAEVRSEQKMVQDTHQQLQEKMDHLVDTLSYLADRCRTRKVVAGTPSVLSEENAEGGVLIDEVNSGLAALSTLAEMGDTRLADNTLDALAEDISQLERAGLQARAEADAAIEIDRLLAQFPTAVTGSQSGT
jgi:hypothetical protein